METVKVKTSQNIDIDYPVAGLGERIAARLIDFAIFIVVFLLFFIVLGRNELLKGASTFRFIPLIIFTIGYVFYDLLCEIFMNGQSIGKRFLKIKVISLDGSQPNIGQYLIRWIFRIVDFALTQGLSALISVAATENKQRIGDIVAGTTLIKTIPRTQLHHIAFHPTDEEYTPLFNEIYHLTDRDIELVHEVLNTYFKTGNYKLIHQTASKVS